MPDALFKIGVTVDPQGAVPGVSRVAATLDRLERRARSGQAANDNLSESFRRVGASAAGAGSGIGTADRQLRAVAASSGPAAGGVNRVASGMNALKGAAITFISIGTAKVFTDMADKAGLMDAKLRLATDGWGSYNVAQADVQRVSANTRSEITSVAVLYGRLAKTGQNLNASQLQVARGTETVTKALKVSGAGANETQAAVLQLGQALGSGKLGGDEFSSLMETAPRLMQLFADSIGKPVGSLKKLASEGKLTSDIIFKALTDPKFTAKLDDEFKALPKTFGDAMTAVTNTATVVFGAFNEGGGFSTALYNFASGGEANMTRIADAARSEGVNIRASFAGLYDAFNPLLAGGTSVFSQLGIQVQSLRSQIAGMLGMFDTVVNFLPKLQNAANKWDREHLGDTIYARGLKDVPLQNTQATYRQSEAKYRMANSRQRIVSNYQKKTGDYKFTGDGMNGQQLFDAFNKAKPMKRGGTGVLVKPPTAPSTKGDGKKKDSGASDADRKAKAEKEFWETLKGEVVTAGLMPKAAEDYRKEQELQKILGRELLADEKSRIAVDLQKVRIAKLITGMQVTHEQTSRELADQEMLIALKRGGMSEEQLAVEKAVLGQRREALDAGATIADLQTDTWKAAEALLRTDQTRLGVLKQQDDRLDEQLARIKDMAKDGASFARESVAQYGTRSDKMRAIEKTRADGVANLNEAAWSTDPKYVIDSSEFEAGMTRINEEYEAAMREIPSVFAEKMYNVADLFGSIADRLSGALGKLFNQASGLARGFGDFESTKLDIGSKFDKAFGIGPNASPLVKGIGKAVGGAVAGAGIGEQIAGLGKALGVKTSKVGGQVGGAIGGAAFGPIGAAVGGALGSIVGGFFKKTPKGAAVITSGTSSTVTGNKGSVRDSLTGSVSSLQGGLQSIAQQLGGELGDFRVSIGKYKDSYRVSSSGASNVDTKKSGKISGLVYNGKDEAAAIAAALQDAISDGAVTGISDLMQKALRAGSANLDKAVQDAMRIKDFEAAYKEMFDPIAAGVESITGPLKALRETMIAVGASTADLTKVDEYRAKRLDQVLKDQVSGFQSILDDLNGDAGGVTALTQLTSNLDKFKGFQTDAAAGRLVDQDAFKELAQKIISGTNDVYGANSSEAQGNFALIKSATNSALSNATNAFNNAANGGATNQAIAEQTNAITSGQGVTNDYLRQLLEAVQSGGALAANISNGGIGVYNGRLVQAF